MRRELFDLLHPFVRGARLGAYIAGVTLTLTLAGAVAVLTTQPEAQTTSYVASDAPTIPPDRPMKSRAVVEIDRALLAAAERLDSAGSRPLELSRDAGAGAPPPPAEAAAQAPAPAPATPAPAPAAAVVPSAPPLVVTDDALRSVIAQYFPDQVDFVYGVVMCESSGNARAVSRGGRYYGMWQFDLATWQSVGGTGLPSDASVEEQMMRARMLYDARGWQPWGCA